MLSLIVSLLVLRDLPVDDIDIFADGFYLSVLSGLKTVLN